MHLPKQAFDHTGRIYGRWTVLQLDHLKPRGNGKNTTMWLCICRCGSQKVVSGEVLKNGHSQSCGCLNIETVVRRSTVHGHKKRSGASRTYNAWCNMIRRCTWDTGADVENYKARGISVCSRWLDSFENFLSDMGEAPEDLSIERIDVNGNYEPGNCRWDTDVAQARNTRKVHRVGAGVRLSRNGKRWVAKLALLGKRLHLGTFDTQEEAIAAREMAIQKYWKEAQ